MADPRQACIKDVAKYKITAVNGHPQTRQQRKQPASEREREQRTHGSRREHPSKMMEKTNHPSKLMEKNSAIHPSTDD